MTVTRFYAGWDRYNAYFVDAIRGLTPEQLAIRPAPNLMPIWGTVAHTAGARAYWLCGVLGEPGVEKTPFDPDFLASGFGWEDDESHPRSADELVTALETTWDVVAGCLERWTPELLEEPFTREYGGRRSVHTRQSVLMRMLSHDAYHCGELSQTLGIHGLPQIDLWPPQRTSSEPQT